MSLALQGSRLVATRRGGGPQTVVQKPITTEDILGHVGWSGRPHTPNSDRSQVVTRHVIGTAGISTMLSATITIEAGTLTKGRCYVRLVLEDRDQVEKGTIFQGYVYAGHIPFGTGSFIIRLGDQLRLESNCSLASVSLIPRGTLLRDKLLVGGWTGTNEGPLDGPGRLLQVIGTNPAQGTSGAVETVPDNARWKFLSDSFNMTTNSTAGNRLPMIIVTKSGGSQVSRLIGHEFQTASEVLTWHFAIGMTTLNLAAQGQRHGFMAPDIELDPGDTIATSIGSFQGGGSGDDLGAQIIYVEEWIQP